MCIKDQWPYQREINIPNPTKELPASAKAPNPDLKDMDVLCSYKIKIESQTLKRGWQYPKQDTDSQPQSGSTAFSKAKNHNIVVQKTFDHIQINIKMPNPSQEPVASSKAPNEDFEDMDDLCIFKIKIESKNLDHGCIKDKWPYQIKFKIQSPSQEPPVSAKAQNQDSGTWNFFVLSKSR